MSTFCIPAFDVNLSSGCENRSFPSVCLPIFVGLPVCLSIYLICNLHSSPLNRIRTPVEKYEKRTIFCIWKVTTIYTTFYFKYDIIIWVFEIRPPNSILRIFNWGQPPLLRVDVMLEHTRNPIQHGKRGHICPPKVRIAKYSKNHQIKGYWNSLTFISLPIHPV